MREKNTELNKAHNESSGNIRIFGNDTKVEVVQAYAEKDRAWLKGKPVCELLKQRHILHAGVMRAQAPFEIVRTDLSGTFMLVCTAGKGKVLVDGQWKTLSAGQACVQPPFMSNAIKCIPGESWDFCWIRYVESREVMPIVSDVTPVMGEYDPVSLQCAIRGLINESGEGSSSAREHHWVELIHQYVMKFTQSQKADDRLWKLWKAVRCHYDKEWTLHDLAQMACVSEEHLRRLCKKQLGRSPIQHLTFLRIQHACEMLAATDEKIEFIARSVGYKSAYHFSNVFTKWVGKRPSACRG